MAVALAAPVGAAHALEVDRIEVMSRLGEPLRAEIPVSGSVGELQALQAQLAAPVTFARIGLPRPQGVVAGLRFAVVRDGGGAVIRVSSGLPVEEDFFTFLVQLDWGAGRLVREYSVALSADSLPAAAAPPLRSAAVASDRIVRAPEAAAMPEPADEGVAIPLAGRREDAGAAAATPTPVVPAPAIPIPLASTPAAPPRSPVPETPAASKPVPGSAPASASEPVPAARAAPAPSKPAPAAATQATAGELGPVRTGDTLTAIASALGGSGHTLDQKMLALLRANPHAFARGNINLLRRGAVLRAPTAEALSQYDAVQAAAVVAEQIRQWRDGEMPAMHPAALADVPSPQAASTAPATAARVTPARLEIAPSPAETAATAVAAAQSGIAGAGDGSELRPQLPADAAANQTAPAVQVEQMQARIAELEALQRDQKTLIALQNSALAARQRSGLSWGWIVAALAAVFALGWALARWRTAKRPTHPGSAAAHARDAAPAPETSTAASATTDPSSPQSPPWHGERGEDRQPI